MGEFSITHLLLLLVIFLIFFGPSRLPELGKAFGKSIKNFKQGLNEIDVDAKDIHDSKSNQASQHLNQQNPNAQNIQNQQTQNDPTKNHQS